MKFARSSDLLIEEAAGGEASAKLFRETDEQGFRESEVTICILYLWIFPLLTIICCFLALQTNFTWVEFIQIIT